MKKCKLCLQEKKLCDSHIISEFFYKKMYDSKHRIILLNNKPQESLKFRHKGAYDKLLCQDCEKIINEYESYAIEQLTKKTKIRYTQNDKAVFISSLDYSLFKLFALSILWRASISNHFLFKDVGIGTNEGIIRNMLLNKNPDKYDKYAIMMFLITSNRMGTAEDLVTSPELIKIDDIWAYRFVFGGYVWIYFIGEIIHPTIKQLVLQPDGSIIIPKKEMDDIKFIVEFGLELHKQGKLGLDPTKFKR